MKNIISLKLLRKEFLDTAEGKLKKLKHFFLKKICKNI
jgi:hypothetical protein